MISEDAKTQSDDMEIVKQPKIKASVEWWRKFDAWRAGHGHQSLPEGIRAAVNNCIDRTAPRQA